MKKTKKLQLGVAILELMLAMGLMAILLPPLLSGLYTARSEKAQQNERIQAVALLRGTEEAVRNIRTQNWNTFINVTEGSPYHPIINASTSKWEMTPGTGTVNGFTQSVIVSSVSRDSSGNIVTSGGTNDPSTKKVVTTISWTKPLSSSTSSTIYLTRYLNNAPYSQTLKADFDRDSLNNVISQNTSGGPDGEVVLGPNPHAKWCSPSLSAQTIDLPDGPPVAVSARSSSVSNSIPNDVLVAVAPYPTTQVKLAYVNVPANQDPPVPVLRGIFSLDPAKYSQPTLIPTPADIGLDNNFKTNGIKYYTSASGKLYALLATTKSDREVVAVLVNDNDDNSNSEYQDPTNKIFKYKTFFNTKIYGQPTLAPTATPTPTSTPAPTNTPTPTSTPTPTPAVYTTGFVNPSANVADTGGDGNGYQTSPTNAYTDNATFATDTNSGTTTTATCGDSGKDRHRFYNYGMAIPAGSTIRGIEIRLDAKADSVTGAPFICVELSWDGGTTWTATKSTSTLTTSEATYVLGSSVDTWGRSWTNTQFSDANFRIRVTDVASNITRDFSLDWAAVQVYYNGFTPTNTPIPTNTPFPTNTPMPTNTPTPTPTPVIPNDQAPFGYGATSIAVQGNNGYVTSGGFLYVFDLSNIDSKTTSDGLDQIGCRILLDGYDCQPAVGATPGYGVKYSAGQSGATFGPTTQPIHPDCSDGGNIELYADNDVYPIQVNAPNPTPGTYAYVAVGGITVPELNVVNASTPPTGAALTASTCGTSTANWQKIGTMDFNQAANTEEAANSIFVKSDGTRAYMSSNGGVDADGNGQPDSKQFYILDTTSKSTPVFLLGNTTPTPKFGFYTGSVLSPTPSGPIFHNERLFPRRSMTVLNGKRAVLVGKDGLTPTPGVTGPEEYQVLNIDANTTNPAAPTPGSSYEKNPGYCGGVNFDAGFNDLTSVTEADTDTFVYMVANTSDLELKLIEGGPDVTYSAEGTLVSEAYDAGGNATFNRFAATVSQPANTNLYFQIAVANPPDGNCTTAAYTFLGPAGTTDWLTDSYPTSGGKILIADNGNYHNPGKCFKYKATLTSSDQNSTPTVNDVAVNFSP